MSGTRGIGDEEASGEVGGGGGDAYPCPNLSWVMVIWAPPMNRMTGKHL